ncbi:MAG: phage portal protein [Tepidisphaeraceae bacterium]
MIQEDQRNRARNAIANNVIARSLMTAETDYVVAEGYNFQPRSNNPAFNKEAEERYYEWLDRADVTGLRSGTELVRDTWHFPRGDGDGLLAWINVRGRLGLQYIPGDLIQNEFGVVNDNFNFDGIRCDATGRPLWYTVAIKDQFGITRYERILAENACFLSHTTHPMAIRGTSVFATIFQQLDQLDEFVDSVTKAAIMAAIFGLIEKRQNPAAAMQGFGMQQNASGNDQLAVTYEGGMMKVIGAQDSVFQVQAQQPIPQAPDFIRALMRNVCLAFDMPLEIGMRDVSQVNFSGGRIGLLGFYRSCRIKVEWHLSRCWRPTTAKWLEVEKKRQELGYADAFKTPFPADYQKFDLTGREYEANDRVAEAQADLLELSMGKRSLQQLMNAAGIEYQATQDQRKAFFDWCRLNNVPVSLSSLTRDPPAVAVVQDGVSPIDQVRATVDAFGVGVRAGGLTPQVQDEEKLRSALSLPPMSAAAREAWASEGGVRKPITLAKPEDASASTTPATEPN